MSLGAIRLAEKFGLVLLIDQQPQNIKRKPQYLCDDRTPRAQIDAMPREPRMAPPHWRVHRSIHQPRLVPRGGI